VYRIRTLALSCAAPLLLVAVAGAQAQGSRPQQPVRGWELPWLDISPNGGWRVRARAVAANRARLLRQRNFSALNAPVVTGAVSATSVTGTLRVPVIMFLYKDSPAASNFPNSSQYDTTLFGSPPPNGKPYSLRTFYEQMSNGLFSIEGNSAGWVRLDSNEVAYTGTPGTCSGNPFGTTNCNGLFSGVAQARMQNGLREALSKVDAQVDFSQYDENGDGVVDAVLFVHATMDGACGGSSNNHLWSHRYVLTSTGPAYVTNDPRPGGGGNIVVNDYILQSGLGGIEDPAHPNRQVCDSTQIMPIGTAAHELGHILALPDLYDVLGPTQGIGEWGLMGSGNYSKPESPSRYDAWSLEQMGWTTIVPLDTAGNYSVGPEPTADTVFMVDVQGANQDGESFLIENRQAVQSDSALIRLHGGGGLMLWHIDDTKACMIDVCTGNTVNYGTIHGVALEEADGLRQLWCENNGCNRGDGGDPYPGTSDNPAFSYSTNPAGTKNADGSFVGFAVDSIRQLAPNGAMSFRLRFGGLTVVKGSDTSAVIQVDGTPYNVFRDLLADGSSHTIAIPDTQFTNNNRTRLAFVSWTDGGAISHVVTGSTTGATYTALLAVAHRLTVNVGANGTVTSNPAADSSGAYVDQGAPFALTATATPPFVFGGWTGDTTATSAVLSLHMNRPYSLTARFDPQLVIASTDPRPSGLMGKLYADTLQASGGTGAFTWQVVGGTLPPGLALTASGRITGTPRQTGAFTYSVRATSGAQQAVQQLSTTIAAPQLQASAVVAQLLTGTSSLSADDLSYLDLLGNNNQIFDVGDFLAWVQATGATPAAVLAAARREPGARP
jgi:M6 family metalloprotease-like protein